MKAFSLLVVLGCILFTGNALRCRLCLSGKNENGTDCAEEADADGPDVYNCSEFQDWLNKAIHERGNTSQSEVKAAFTPAKGALMTPTFVPKEYNVCRKIYVSTPDTFIGSETKKGIEGQVTRVCGYENEDDMKDSCVTSLGSGGTVEYCSCDEDGCNSPGSRPVSMTIWITFVTVASLAIVM